MNALAVSPEKDLMRAARRASRVLRSLYEIPTLYNEDWESKRTLEMMQALLKLEAALHRAETVRPCAG